MSDNIIPFGKHKGKPVEILANDKQYTDWLLAQSWFKEKHVNLYTVVIQNFREPSDTPEHNKLQIKFLKLEHRLKLAYWANKNLFIKNSEKINTAMLSILNGDDKMRSKFFLESLTNPKPEYEQGLHTRSMLKHSKPIFETIDVSYHLWYGIKFYYNTANHTKTFHQETTNSFFIEIKPTVGDDFPSILRQMKASMPIKVEENYGRNKFYVLLVGEYNGVGATREEFIEYFQTQGYKVAFESEIENITLPAFEIELVLSEEIEDKIQSAKLV